MTGESFNWRDWQPHDHARGARRVRHYHSRSPVSGWHARWVSGDAEDFYDGLAADYHLVYGDQWDAAVARQGASLAGVIRDARPEAVTVLDCSCGIGTQAIGLAYERFRVTGTDISATSISRARAEAHRWGVPVEFGVADFRHLHEVRGQFDVVLSADNALPHLLTDEEMLGALIAMRSKLHAGGLLVVTMRDFDRALDERPQTALPVLVTGPPRRVVVRLHDWDGPSSSFYTLRFLICTEQEDDRWSVDHHQVRYRAIMRHAFNDLVQQVGFTDITWHSGEDVNFPQPVLTATAA